MSEETKEKNNTIKIKKSNLWKVAAVLFAVLFLVVLFVNTGNTKTKDMDSTGNAAKEESVKVTIDSTDPVIGDENAEVSVVEFSDFECPFCAKAFNGAVADLKDSSYFEQGQVNLVYKHLPLRSLHPDAQKAAEASVCSQEQGKFWEYHDKLFLNQNALDVNSLKQYAVDIGLNSGEFNSCLSNDEAKSKVSKDMVQASKLGARGTPYFVVYNNENGDSEIVSGAVPWANFEAAINAVM